MKYLNHLLGNIKILKIGWIIIKKTQPKHDSKWTRLCYLLPTGSRWWLISSWNVKTIEGYTLINCEVASSSSYPDFPKRSFCDSEVNDDSGGVNTIGSRPKVADDVIAGKDADLPEICLFKYVGCYHQLFLRKSIKAIYVMRTRLFPDFQVGWEPC